MGGGGVGGGSGESETERLGEAAAAGGGCATLDFLTWTEDGWSEDTCFSRERIYGNTRRQKEFLLTSFSLEHAVSCLLMLARLATGVVNLLF